MDEFAHLYPWQIVTRVAGARLTCRLMNNISLDISTLRSEVARIVSEYIPAKHSRADHHDGGWSAIGLIAHQGNPFEDRMGLPLKKTPALSLAPYIESVIDGFKAQKGRVRLMELRPKKSVLWHYDGNQSIDGNESVRLHIPILTNSSIRMQISHEDAVWNAGEIWYGDFSFPHRLYNGGKESRVHLVVDLAPEDSVISSFPEGFLDESEKEKRLRVKAVCHHMLDIYAISRLPSEQWMQEGRKVVAAVVGTRQVSRAREHIDRLIPRTDKFILVDQDRVRGELGAGRRVVPFLEQDGRYHGNPQDDATAIRELERLRASGAKFMVFWCADFWWLEYYSGLNRHLRSHYRCVLEDGSLVVFDLEGVPPSENRSCHRSRAIGAPRLNPPPRSRRTSS